MGDSGDLERMEDLEEMLGSRQRFLMRSFEGHPREIPDYLLSDFLYKSLLTERRGLLREVGESYS